MDRLNSLWQGASYQDNLLQSYRNICLTTQSIFLAIASSLLFQVMTTEDRLSIGYKFLSILLGLIIFVGLYLLVTLRSIIKSRAKDVDYFHIEIIKFEDNLEAMDQVMTAFKVSQDFNRKQRVTDEYYSHFDLTLQQKIGLIGKGHGHTRNRLDNILLYFLGAIWVCIITGLTVAYYL